MIILTNCLTQAADEGCLKVAVSLVKRIKRARPETTVIGYDRESPLCDVFLPINKLMLNARLWKLLREKRQSVLFVPFSANMRSTALRTLVVSCYARGQVLLLQSMYSPMGKLAKLFMKLSGAKLICLSRDSCVYYKEKIGEKARYFRTGVDTTRFAPVTAEEKAALREKYGLPKEKPIVLHVGHLKAGRNIGQFLKLDSRYHGLLVVSTHDPSQQDVRLRQALSQKENLTLIDTFLPDIQEIYQLADVYLFPVVERKGCIDAPLSAMEAAACGIPVVATPFRELKTLLDRDGFYEITDFAELTALLQRAIGEQKNPRQAILPYDWNYAVETLLEMEGKEN